MNKKKKIIIGIAVVLLLLQLVRPARNHGEAASENDIFHTVETSDEVKTILITSCFDCHSNHSNYPWYTTVQPIRFWMDHHVDEGKEELNLSEFKTYSLKKQLHKLGEIADWVASEDMPLYSYTFIHGEAKISEAQKQLVVNWAQNARKTLEK